MEKTNRYFLIAFIAIVIIILVIRLYVIKGDCFNLFKKPYNDDTENTYENKEHVIIYKMPEIYIILILIIGIIIFIFCENKNNSYVNDDNISFLSDIQSAKSDEWNYFSQDI